MIAPLVMLALVAPSVPDLGWLSGYWLSCEGGREVSETWSDPRAGQMLGSNLTISQNKLAYELMRIAPSESGISFFAQPSDQPPAEFPLKSAGERQALFENAAHDFPQRVIYRREGDRLLARIEGKTGGKEHAVDWSFAAAALNQRCPAAG